MKREVLTPALALLLLISSLSVYAAPNADLYFIPSSVYETNEVGFNLTVNNYLKNEVINELSLLLTNFTITGVTEYIGWQNNLTSNSIKWFGGDIETNVLLEMFQFTAQADKVTQDTTIIVEIAEKGESGEETVDNINITILNDNTPPLLSENIPVDDEYLLEGVTNQLISIYATDPETGVNHVGFSYWNCTNSSGNLTQVNLNGVNDTYTNILDFSYYKEGELMCFIFEASNNADETAQLIGTVGFDGSPPAVNLIAPDNGDYASGSTLFSFVASDNVAPSLECDFKVDNNTEDSTAAVSGIETSTTFDLSGLEEGNHEWTVTCTDGVGLEATAPQRIIIVDLTPPEIMLNSPENSSFINGNTSIDIEVTDNFDIESIDYSDSNISGWSEGPNTLTVTAVDKAGNVAVADFEFILDNTAPAISLTSPDNNASTDTHVNFVFDTSDNLDSTLDCTLYLDDSAYTTEEISGTGVISVVIPMAMYEWYILCEDGAGNNVKSETRNLNVTDLTGPDIFIEDIEYITRGTDYQFEANITDPSGISDVDADLDGDSISLSANNNIYSGLIETDSSYALGTYTLTITAVDALSNPATLTEEFELIPDYIINAALDNNRVEPGQAVTVSGTIKLDDNTNPPETEATIILPTSIININLDNGSFSNGFNAPSSEGDYEVVIEITDAYDNTYSQRLGLAVRLPAGSTSSSTKGVSTYCGDETCTFTEDCSNCPEDCGVCPSEETIVEEQGDTTVGSTTEEPAETSPSVVGKAAGWFNLSKLAASPLAWIFLTGTVLGLTVMSIKRRKSKDILDWDSYFAKRR